MLVAEIFFMAAQNALQFALFKGIQINFFGRSPWIVPIEGGLPCSHTDPTCAIYYSLPINREKWLIMDVGLSVLVPFYQ